MNMKKTRLNHAPAFILDETELPNCNQKEEIVSSFPTLTSIREPLQEESEFANQYGFGVSTIQARFVAQRLLDELSSNYQLRLYAGYEPEFRLFQINEYISSTKQSLPNIASFDRMTPVTKAPDMFKQVLLNPLEPFLINLDDDLMKYGINVQNYIHEHGRGQLETPLEPKFDLQSADDYLLFKRILAKTSRKYQMIVSFIPVPLIGESASGCHFNHSLWDLAGSSNRFYDPTDSDRISKLTRHWIGGLITHMAALIASTSPTINCYQRLHGLTTPSKANWEINHRQYALRVINRGPHRTFIENRLPSSASCPYHVIAATIAAGLDGLEREIEPPPPGETEAKCLPNTLSKALDEMLSDNILCERLGAEFVERFIRMRESL